MLETRNDMCRGPGLGDLRYSTYLQYCLSYLTLLEPVRSSVIDLTVVGHEYCKYERDSAVATSRNPFVPELSPLVQAPGCECGEILRSSWSLEARVWSLDHPRSALGTDSCKTTNK